MKNKNYHNLQENAGLISPWISFNTIGVILSLMSIISALISFNPFALIKSCVGGLVSAYAVMVVTSFRFDSFTNINSIQCQ